MILNLRDLILTILYFTDSHCNDLNKSVIWQNLLSWNIRQTWSFWTLFTLCMGHLRVPNQEEVVLEAAWNNSMFRSFFAFFSQVYPYFSNDDKTV